MTGYLIDAFFHGANRLILPYDGNYYDLKGHRHASNYEDWDIDRISEELAVQPWRQAALPRILLASFGEPREDGVVLWYRASGWSAYGGRRALAKHLPLSLRSVRLRIGGISGPYAWKGTGHAQTLAKRSFGIVRRRPESIRRTRVHKGCKLRQNRNLTR